MTESNRDLYRRFHGEDRDASPKRPVWDSHPEPTVKQPTKRKDDK